MAIKAVFFDIDGTFLNDRKRVSSSTKKAISQMKEDGILVMTRSCIKISSLNQQSTT